MNDALVRFVEGFFALIQTGADTFVGIATGIIPTLLILMTLVNLIVRLIGPERVERTAEKLTGNVFARYLVLPVISVIVLMNPLATTMGRFLKEEHKPGFIDATESFFHPPLGLFPHINPAEIFVYMGIAIGIQTLGLSLAPMAVRAFLAGLVVILVRGIITERIMALMMARRGITVDSLYEVAEEQPRAAMF